MEKVHVGDMISGSFQFVRDRFRTVLVWSAIYFAITLGAQLAMRPLYQKQFTAMQAGMAGTPGLPGQAALSVLVGSLLVIAIIIVLNAAIFRAALHPERSAFAYLRFGMDELRLFLLLLLLTIAFFIGFFIATIVVELIVFALIAAGGVGRIFGVILGIVGGLALFGAMIFFVVRFASAGPLTILRKKIVIGESWRLTRGHFWALFGTYFVVAVVWLVGWLVLLKITFSGAMGDAFIGQMRHPGDPVYQQALIAAQVQQANDFGIGHVVIAAVVSVLYIFLIA